MKGQRGDKTLRQWYIKTEDGSSKLYGPATERECLKWLTKQPKGVYRIEREVPK